MPIRIIVNGYFRSGTTYLWHLMKRAMENEHCYYEPLNDHLALYVRHEMLNKKAHPVHGIRLWEEYVKLDPAMLDKLLKNHPSTTKDGISSEVALGDFLDIFDQIDSPVLLQTNRLHFFLQYAFERYSAKVVHVVRDPIDVYLSMQETYRYNRSSAKRLLKMAVAHWGFRGAFDIERDYDWIRRRVGFPPAELDSWRLLLTRQRIDSFRKFCLVWTISNLVAVRTTERVGGYILPYEKLVKEPAETVLDLSRYLGIALPTPDEKHHAQRRKVRSSMIRRARDAVRYLQIEDEYQELTSRIHSQGGPRYFSV